MIHELHLKNFKRHSEGNFHFGPGLTAIQGDNAIGKSTLLKAILFALRGPAAVGNKEHIPTRGGDGTTQTKLKLQLPGHGLVTIERTLKNAKVFAEDGALLANGVSPVTKLVEEAFGMAAADLELLMYSRQGESQALLEMGAAALQKTVERLAKTDLVDKVLELLGKDRAHLEGALANIGELGDPVALAKQLGELREACSTLRVHLEQVEAEKGHQQTLEQDLQQQYGKAQQLVLQQSRLRAEISTHLSRLDALSGKLAELQDALNAFPDHLPALMRDAKAQETIKQAALSDLEQRLQMIAHLDTRCISLVGQIANLALRVAKSEAVAEQLGAAEESYTKLLALRVEAGLEASRRNSALYEAERAIRDAACQTCNRPFSEADFAFANQRSKAAKVVAAEAGERLQTVKSKVQAAEAEVAKLRESYFPDGSATLAEAHAQYDKEGEALKSQLGRYGSAAELQKDAEDLRKQIAEARAVWANYNTLHLQRSNAETLLQAATKEQEKARKALADLQLEQAKLPASQDPDVLLPLLTQTRAKLSELQGQHAELGTTLALTEQRRDSTSERLQALQEEIAKKDSMNRQLALRKRLQTWLRNSRAELMLEVWDGLFNYASYLLNTTSGGAISRVYRLDGEIVVDEANEVVPVSELSGAQRSMAGACLRIALAKVFYGGDLPLLLDEITESMRDENAARVAGMLQGLGSQVIMVTHRVGDSVNTQQTIYLGE